ncbi:hypothetical protein [Vibrio mimicus]|uniref:hypothetical protein n=1 Tax=Vibrio mimicus TaxID=674 RepID=UPI0005B6344F|nr:hypothetical protein [Vibrio mimicus]
MVEFSTNGIRWLACLLFLFVIPLFYLPVREGEWGLSLILLFMFGIPLLLLYAYSATVKLKLDSIHISFVFGAYEINWHEVESYSVRGGNLKLRGHGKSVTLPSFEFWGGNRHEAYEFFHSRVDEHDIVEAPGYIALIPTFFGTKVSNRTR